MHPVMSASSAENPIPMATEGQASQSSFLSLSSIAKVLAAFVARQDRLERRKIVLFGVSNLEKSPPGYQEQLASILVSSGIHAIATHGDPLNIVRSILPSAMQGPHYQAVHSISDCVTQLGTAQNLVLVIATNSQKQKIGKPAELSDKRAKQHDAPVLQAPALNSSPRKQDGMGGQTAKTNKSVARSLGNGIHNGNKSSLNGEASSGSGRKKQEKPKKVIQAESSKSKETEKPAVNGSIRAHKSQSPEVESVTIADASRRSESVMTDAVSYPYVFIYTEEVERFLTERSLFLSHPFKIKGVYSYGEEVRIEAPVFVEPFTTMPGRAGFVSCGAYTYLFSNPGAGITFGRYCSVGKNVRRIGVEHPLDRISTHIFTWRYYFKNKIKEETGVDLKTRKYSKSDRGPIVVGNDVMIGEDVLIRSGVTIGDGAVIGAGSVVVKDVPAFAIVAGNPARLIRYRFDPDTIGRIQRIAWWQYPVHAFADLEFTNIHAFLDGLEKRIKSGKLTPDHPEKINLACQIDQLLPLLDDEGPWNPQRLNQYAGNDPSRALKALIHHCRIHPERMEALLLLGELAAQYKEEADALEQDYLLGKALLCYRDHRLQHPDESGIPVPYFLFKNALGPFRIAILEERFRSGKVPSLVSNFLDDLCATFRKMEANDQFRGSPYYFGLETCQPLLFQEIESLLTSCLRQSIQNDFSSLELDPYGWRFLYGLTTECFYLEWSWYFRKRMIDALKKRWSQVSNNLDAQSHALVRDMMLLSNETGDTEIFSEVRKHYEAKGKSYKFIYSSALYHEREVQYSSAMSGADQLFHDYMKGKRVALVGPVDVGLENGAEIDTYDIVVRMNYLGLRPSEERKFGTRTHVSFYAITDTERIGNSDSIRMINSLDWMVIEQRVSHDPTRFSEIKANIRVGLNRYSSNTSPMLIGHPNAIQRSLIDLKRFQPAEIKIFNANLFMNMNYSEGYAAMRTKKYPLMNLHDPGANFLLLKRMFEKGHILADPVLTEILGMPMEQYLESISKFFSIPLDAQVVDSLLRS